MSFVDPTGKAVPVLIAACAANPACAAAVGTGALTSALFDFGSQLLNNGGNLQCVDKGSLALSAGIGAIPLGVVGAIGSKLLGKFAAKGVDKVVDAATPIGRRGSPIDVRRGTNSPAKIGDRDFTGHALDQMQGRGITPTVVNDTIKRGVESSGREGSRIFKTDQLKVILNPSGSVKTVVTQ